MSVSKGQKPQALRWLQRESLRKSTAGDAGDALNTQAQEVFAKSEQLEHGETIMSVSLTQEHWDGVGGGGHDLNIPRERAAGLSNFICN